MGRLLTNPPKPVIRVKVSQKNYRKVLSLAYAVHGGILANVGTFVTPFPTMVNFNNDILALATAIAALGTKTNKNGKAALTTCINASVLVYHDLIQLAAYVSAVVYESFPNNPFLQAQVIASSGFAAKSPKSRIDTLQFVRNAKQVNNKKFPHTLGYISWKKSLGLFKGTKITGFNVYDVTASPHTFLGSTTKTNFTLPAPVANVNSKIQIRPFNARGEGNGITITAFQTIP